VKTNFLVVGAQRSGTTTLRRCLTQHPQVRMAEVQARPFFINDELFERGTPSYDKYHEGRSDEADTVYGDVGVQYAYWQQSIPRIYRYNRDMKLVMLLRNPIERAYSAWQQTHHQGAEEQQFVEAINLEPYRLRNANINNQHKVYSYLDQGFYSRQIEQIYQYFDPHQVLLLRSDDFADNPEVTMYQILEFLELPFIESDTAAQELGSYKESMPSEVYNELIEIFRRDIYRVEELTGWNCSNWLAPKAVKVRSKELYHV